MNQSELEEKYVTNAKYVFWFSFLILNGWKSGASLAN